MATRNEILKCEELEPHVFNIELNDGSQVRVRRDIHTDADGDELLLGQYIDSSRNVTCCQVRRYSPETANKCGLITSQSNTLYHAADMHKALENLFTEPFMPKFLFIADDPHIKLSQSFKHSCGPLFGTTCFGDTLFDTIDDMLFDPPYVKIRDMLETCFIQIVSILQVGKFNHNNLHSRNVVRAENDRWQIIGLDRAVLCEDGEHKFDSEVDFTMLVKSVHRQLADYKVFKGSTKRLPDIGEEEMFDVDDKKCVEVVMKKYFDNW
jgi:hypothetical protein